MSPTNPVFALLDAKPGKIRKFVGVGALNCKSTIFGASRKRLKLANRFCKIMREPIAIWTHFEKAANVHIPSVFYVRARQLTHNMIKHLTLGLPAVNRPFPEHLLDLRAPHAPPLILQVSAERAYWSWRTVLLYRTHSPEVILWSRSEVNIASCAVFLSIRQKLHILRMVYDPKYESATSCYFEYYFEDP